MYSSRIVLNQRQIEAINWRNLQREETGLTDLADTEMTLAPEQIEMAFHLEKLGQEPRYNGSGICYGEAFYNSLKRKIYASLPDDMFAMRCAVAVQNALIRAYPTMAGSYRKDEIGELDRFAVSVLKIGEPVLLVCEDVEKIWCYIITAQVQGWVLRNTLALEPDNFRWRQYCSSLDTVTVADGCYSLCYTGREGICKKQMLFMGTQLPLYDVTRDAFVLGLPTKDRNGNFAVEQLRVPRDGGIIPGFLPFSAQNIISQAKKLLGEPYGWGGSNFHRDCTSLVMDVYATFGLQVPRNSCRQIQMFGVERCPENRAQKETFIRELMPGSILYFPGHAMLYLGEENGSLKILHSVYAIGLPEKERIIPHKLRRVAEGSLQQYRINGELFLDAVNYVWVPDHQSRFLNSG